MGVPAKRSGVGAFAGGQRLSELTRGGCIAHIPDVEGMATSKKRFLNNELSITASTVDEYSGV